MNNSYGDKLVSIFGFKFKVKNLILTFTMSCFVFLVLLLLDMYVTPISWYGVIIGVGFLVAIVCAVQLCGYRGLPDDFPYDLILWIFPLSIIFARIYYVICSPEEFANFGEMIAVWNGGIAIYGGIIGGVIGIVICCFIKKRNILSTLDMAAPCLIIAQSIGRWGNFINQEVYGMEVTNKAMQWFPFAVHITKNGADSWHLATFFYESILTCAGFFLLVWILRKFNIKGIVTCSYLIFYGVVRFFLEGLRETEYILNIPGTKLAVSKVVSLAIILAGVVWLTILILKNRKQPSEKTENLKNSQ
jgi:phosphatidylglycerol:prolipoprotein diacylglycerol transferase